MSVTLYDIERKDREQAANMQAGSNASKVHTALTASGLVQAIKIFVRSALRPFPQVSHG
jgi:hypothetical protein